MATKKPLALYSGKVKELQSGDDVGYKKVISRVKMARETVTSSTTLQDDDDFVFPVEANKSYCVFAQIVVSAANTGGFKWLFGLPTGSTGRVNTSNQIAMGGNIDTDAVSGANSSGTVGLSIYPFTGFLNTTGNIGNVVFRWAQQGSHTIGTYIERGSIMTLTEI